MNDPYEHEDYRPAGPTPRHALADELARWLTAKGLGTALEAQRDEAGRCYRVGFTAAHGAGTVSVYAPDYLRVDFSSLVAGMPPSGSRLLGSAEHVMVWLEAAFLEEDVAAAAAVAERVPKRGRKIS